MTQEISRRSLLAAAGTLAAAQTEAQNFAKMPPPKFESADTPKICLGLDAAAGADDQETGRLIRQLGVTHVISGLSGIPWEEEKLKSLMDRMKAQGLTLANVMISGFPNAIYNRPGRDQDIEKVIASIEIAGRLGLPVVEYNWYAHRAMEGYFAEEGRGGAGWTGFDYERMKGLPPLAEEGAHTLDEMWANITYFLKAVIPAAEKAGVRMALHPNDPPAPLSRGSQQIMATIDGWKHLVGIVKSPSNGITFDCGVTREMGGDPVEVCRYFSERDCINHVHFRNVKVKTPYLRYTEVFIDEGDNNMYAVMKELVRRKYPRLIYPEHPRGLDYDKQRTGFHPQYPGGGAYAAYAFNVGYARAMMQAALTTS